MGTVLNRARYPSDVIALVVLWRLRYKLSLRDLPEMFAVRGMVFSYEAVREWGPSSPPPGRGTPAPPSPGRRRRTPSARCRHPGAAEQPGEQEQGLHATAHVAARNPAESSPQAA
ncbi:MAG: hypothetical protein M3Y41_19250, partial [Pseudomonadota bacterium]|nr:hypothetical protein [Pseudomonadota bacterium]